MKVIVQLIDGREIVFPDAQVDTNIVAELQAQGVQLSDIKQTIHIIPRDLITPTTWRGVRGVSGD